MNRHLGVVRALSEPKKGDWVCLCLHPNPGYTGHLKGKLILIKEDAVEPYVVETGAAYVYGNTKQVTTLMDNGHCPYDDEARDIVKREQKAIVELEWAVEYTELSGPDRGDRTTLALQSEDRARLMYRTYVAQDKVHKRGLNPVLKSRPVGAWTEES